MKNATLVAPHPPLRAEDLAAASARRWSELVVLDLAVPRNVEPAERIIEDEIKLTRLHHLSDMERQIVRNMAQRLIRRVLYPVSRGFRDVLPADTAGQDGSRRFDLKASGSDTFKPRGTLR